MFGTVTVIWPLATVWVVRDTCVGPLEALAPVLASAETVTVTVLPKDVAAKPLSTTSVLPAAPPRMTLACCLPPSREARACRAPFWLGGVARTVVPVMLPYQL